MTKHADSDTPMPVHASQEAGAGAPELGRNSELAKVPLEKWNRACKLIEEWEDSDELAIDLAERLWTFYMSGKE